MKIFAKIRFYWGAFVISFIVACGMIPMMYLIPSKKGWFIHFFNKVILFLLGAKVEVIGEQDKNADLYLLNHQSIIDIIALESIEYRNYRWVAKKELFEAPWFGRLLKQGEMIRVDRESKSGLVALIKDAKYTLENTDRPIAIFPEGTRASSQELLPFRIGAKYLAEKLNLTVQPIVVLGSKWVLNEHNKTAHSGVVKIIFLESFNVKDAPKNWYEEIRKKMQKIIDNEYLLNKIER
jgi:1-acyl-sn-glycerol-3-phosphate acyltransferase